MITSRRKLYRSVWLVLITVLLLAACEQTPAPTPTAQPTEISTPELTEGRIVLSEVLPGVPGNNNYEFVELYNAGATPVDLNGWSLWFRLADNQDEKLVYRWEAPAEAPGYGHILLAHAGQEYSVLADATYTQPLFERKGGLVLRDVAGETVDAVGWGEGLPAGYVEGAPAPVPTEGASLERLPGAEEGNGSDGDNNAGDFALSAVPNPQNSGSPPTPLPERRLVLSVTLPESVEPGSAVAYEVSVQNLTGDTLQGLRVSLPLPPEYTVVSLPDNVGEAAGRLTWRLAELGDGATETVAIALQAPWTYATCVVGGAYIESADWPLRAYGPLQRVAIEGGFIPIAAARTLEGKNVTVEGVATMYTGGFYAGGGGTKFYLEDETGGIQVYCPGGEGVVDVAIGDRVRVSGEIELYRNAVEIIPGTYDTDVEILEAAGEPALPTLAISDLGEDESLLGRAGTFTGTLTGIQELNFSYELDLAGDEGYTAHLNVEKQTGVNVEPLEVGKMYRVSGVIEIYVNQWQVKPRRQEDFVEIFPPELLLEMMAQNSVLPGGVLTYTLTASNHTGEQLTHVRISTALPEAGLAGTEALDGGVLEDGKVTWGLDELAPAGGSATVRVVVQVAEDAPEQLVSGEAAATADQWPDPVTTEPWTTFVGSGVPIWAIQGPGMESPYVRSTASTEGLVTGVFPELGGFWIQSPEPDDDPATSEGLFVLTENTFTTPEELAAAVAQGDRVMVQGKIREKSGQTLLDLQTPEDLIVVSVHNLPPEAVALDPPEEAAEAETYYETLEGMLVQLGEPAVAVAPTSKYGETVLVLQKWDVARVMRGDPTGWFIFVDDGSAATHADRSTMSYAMQTGDVVTDVVGPLAYTYENYKIQPVITPTIISEESPLPALEPTEPAAFSIATFNTENFFDFKDPHPTDPPKPSVGEYKHKLAKTADAIVAMGLPTIVGLQEIENIEVLQDLAEQDALAAYDYRPVLIEGTDSRGIDVGYLVRGDRATVEGAAAYPAPGGLTSRPPLLITVTTHLESGDRTVYVLNNHFTSMSGGEEATEPRRNEQAAWNVTLVEQLLAQDAEAYVVVLGDLNSFYDSLPLDTLRESGLRHVYELVAPDLPYSYIYQGESETLDHILVTSSLYEHLSDVNAVHIDADYPLPWPDDPSARHVSDHDPVVAVFSFD